MNLPRIGDHLVRCHLCGAHAPLRNMTMNDDELWECDDTDACAARRRARA